MSQVILRGIEQISPLLVNKKFLLVKDSAYDHLGIKSFFDAFPHIEFSNFTPNPLYEQVCEGIELFRRECCDAIVAVGGGSAIDVAKCIKLYSKMNSNENYLKQEMFDSGIPLIAVPTTAGTGSESTRHAVIYFEGKKQSISHISIIPDYAVLEPSVLKTLPVYQKKCTLLDALSQAIESWWSVNSTDESKLYSKQAISKITENWRAYIFDHSNTAATEIMEAANLAGQAINITATTAAHAMSYKITSLYKLPHGHAVAVCLPKVWQYMTEHTEECIDERGTEYLSDTLREISEMISFDEFSEILVQMEITQPTATNREEELKILSQSVNPVRLKNNPVFLNENVLKELYERIIL